MSDLQGDGKEFKPPNESTKEPEDFFGFNDSTELRSQKVYGESHVKLDGTMETPRDHREDSPEEKKKKRAYEALYEQIHMDLMAQVTLKLEVIQWEMQQNREEWEERANRLDALDDVFAEVKDGKELDREKAQQIIKSAGKSISQNASNAEYYTLLVAIKSDDLEHIEVLDQDYEDLVEQEQHYKTIQEKAQNIANDDNLDSNQKLVAYEKLNDEMSKADLIIVSINTENQEQKLETKAVIKNEYEDQRGSLTYDVSRLNF